MSLHDYDCANQAKALVRADLNNALLAIVSSNSNATTPTTTFPYMFWFDSANNLLKCRNAADSAWVTVGATNVDNFGLLSLEGGTLTGALLSAVGAVGAPGIAFSGDLDSGFYWVSANTWGLVANGTEYLRISTAGITFLGTGSTQLPSGTTAQRPGSPVNGMIRYNSDLTVIETYLNGDWKTLASATTYPYAVSDFANSINSSAFITGVDFDGHKTVPKIRACFPWGGPHAKLTDPTALAGVASDVAVSPCGEYVACAHATSPYVSVLQRTGTGFLKIANPITLPTGSADSCAWSPRGDFLAVTHASSPYVSVYSRSGSVLTKIANPTTLPPGAGKGLGWSPNGEFLAVGHSSGGGIPDGFYWYKRSGSGASATLTKQTVPSGSFPSTAARFCDWSPCGRFLVVSEGSHDIFWYEVTGGNTLTYVNAPTTLGGIPSGLKFSPNGEYLAVPSATGWVINIFQRSGTTLTKLTLTGDYYAPGNCTGCDWSPDGDFLFVSHNSTPYMSVYTLNGLAMAQLAAPVSTPPAANGNSVSVSKDGQFAYVAISASPYVAIFQTGLDMEAESIFTIKKRPRSGT